MRCSATASRSDTLRSRVRLLRAALLLVSLSRRFARRRFSLNRTTQAGADKGSIKALGATVAGEANKPGGVYDRLSNKKTYTGVYAKRFDGSGGRINGDTINGRSYTGDTNGGTDVRVDDISQILRR